MSALRTGDVALGSISNILLRMRDLATQASNGTNNTEDTASLNKEYEALKVKSIISLTKHLSMVLNS